ncbi:MAG TPA: hypothetical protein VEZ46_09030 [Mycobacteriales bacterium]|jgi:hypothetical protein|nr:hypothetical protein [Mycobacteriales bacterium]
MTLVTAKCPECRTTDSVPADAMLVEVAAPEQPSEHIGGCARWICSTCSDVVGRAVAWHELALLLAAGARLLSEHVTETLPAHPESPPTGARFTLNDVLELHETLAGEEWFERLTTDAI